MLKGIKTIDDFSFKGKRVIVRIDINSPIKNGKIENNDRIRFSGETIKEIQRKGGRVVVIAHQGRKGGNDFRSLKQHSKLLGRYCKINFVNDVIGRKAKDEILRLKDGEALLLENIRKLDGEVNIKKGKKIIDFFVKLGFNIYINDSFSVSHRRQTSISELPRFFDSGMGRTFEGELRNIDKVKNKNCLYILGGNKPRDLMLLIKKKKIIATGVFGILCNIAEGNYFGLENKKRKREIKELNEKIKRELKHIKTPKDYGFLINRERVEKSLNELPVNARALDIGEKTIKEYEEEIKKAKFIFFKGTPGDCSYKGFCLGTKRLLKEMEKSKAFCVVAGGHSSNAVKEMNINERKLGYVSLSGGALIYYIAGKNLPGLEALKK